MTTLDIVKRLGVASALAILAMANPALAQSDHEQLVAAAKKEGRVMAYGEIITPTWRTIQAGFEKKYPGITMEFLYLSGQPMMTRVLSEEDAGRHVADILMLDVLRLPILKEKGYFAQYLSREHANYDAKWQSNPPGYWIENHVYLGGIMYNTKVVPADRAPKSFEDLLTPEWKGKIALVSPVANDLIFYMFAGIVRDMGEERAFRFFRALKGQNPLVFGPGGIRVSQGVNTGEFPVGIGFVGHVYSVGGGERGNMAIAPLKPTYALTGPGACVMAHAPHPNAARLLVDYINSREAQEKIVELGYFSTFRNLPPRSALSRLTVSTAPTPQGPEKDALQARIKDALGL